MVIKKKAEPPRREPILVVGGTSKTGELIVIKLLQLKQPVRLLVEDVHEAKRMFESLRIGGYLELRRGNMFDPKTVKEVVKNVKALIFAEAARKSSHHDSSSPRNVDYIAVQLFAKYAHDAGVQKFVLLSQTGDTRNPFQFNLFANASVSKLHWILKGENEVRKIYRDRNYTIIRPLRIKDDCSCAYPHDEGTPCSTSSTTTTSSSSSSSTSKTPTNTNSTNAAADSVASSNNNNPTARTSISPRNVVHPINISKEVTYEFSQGDRLVTGHITREQIAGNDLMRVD
eukprot:GEZU01016770.1.p1 GENE.GEZU01016770.1~~GEZU01016770.1.p1  ORF type:complete len:286 (+),score=68.20 GEZU01016770.1:128-985(+)